MPFSGLLFCHGLAFVDPLFDNVHGLISHDRHEKTGKMAHRIFFPCWFCTLGSTGLFYQFLLFWEFCSCNRDLVRCLVFFVGGRKAHIGSRASFLAATVAAFCNSLAAQLRLFRLSILAFWCSEKTPLRFIRAHCFCRHWNSKKVKFLIMNKEQKVEGWVDSC